MANHRGRRRYGQYDDQYSDYEEYYETRPRSRSIGRKALDKLENLVIGSPDRHHDSQALTTTRHHHHSDRHPSGDYDQQIVRRREYHSSSPTQPSGHSHQHHHHHRHHGSHSHHSGSHLRSRSYTHNEDRRSYERSNSHWDRGITAAVDAAAVEAFRIRKEPGPWTGRKGSRIATAAVSAAVIGAATEHRKPSHDRSDKKGTLGSALGGLVVNRIINGPRRDLR